ncbi:MAG: hypothetical protein WC264_00970 [Candidatus Paceibacterota bacterium]|jgi:hypothetical protein
MNKKLILVNPFDISLNIKEDEKKSDFINFSEEIRKEFTDKHYIAISVVCSCDVELKKYADILSNNCFTHEKKYDYWGYGNYIQNPARFLGAIESLFDSYSCVLGLVHYSYPQKIGELFDFFRITYKEKEYKKIKYFISEFKRN